MARPEAAVERGLQEIGVVTVGSAVWAVSSDTALAVIDGTRVAEIHKWFERHRVSVGNG